MQIIPLKNRHIAALQRELRAAKAANLGTANLAELPDAMFNDIAIQAAFKAGWFGETTEAEIDDLTFQQAEALALEVWTAYNEARTVDPNSQSSPPM